MGNWIGLLDWSLLPLSIALAIGGQVGGGAAYHAQTSARDRIRPVPRRRWELRLGSDEREEISRGLAAGESLRMIAAGLGRAPSTVSREVVRNGGRRGYRAVAADRVAWARACRPKQTKLARWPGLRAMVEDKLELCWSPEQVAGWQC